MKTIEPKTATVGSRVKTNQPFLSKKDGEHFFGRGRGEKERQSFFNPLSFSSVNEKGMLQTKCGTCKREEKQIQRQKQPGETKEGDPPQSTPKGNSPRVKKCYTDPEFPDFDCLGYALKLDIDENLFSNTHQFTRVASLFPGDNKLMLDTFLRYGVGKNLLETSFGFAGFGKKWSSRLSYGTGIALKTYDLLQNGQLKLDVQLPIRKGVNIDIKLDINTNPGENGREEKFNTSIGISGRF